MPPLRMHVVHGPLRMNLERLALTNFAVCEELDRIFMADPLQHRVLVCTTRGQHVATWERNHRWEPNAVAVVSVSSTQAESSQKQPHPPFRVIVVNGSSECYVMPHTPDGVCLGRWEVPHPSGLYATVTVWNHAEVYVVNVDGLVTVLDLLTGTCLRQWKLDTSITVKSMMVRVPTHYACANIILAASTEHIVASCETAYSNHCVVRVMSRWGESLYTWQAQRGALNLLNMAVRGAQILTWGECGPDSVVQIRGLDGTWVNQLKVPGRSDWHDITVLRSGLVVMLDRSNVFTVYQ